MEDGKVNDGSGSGSGSGMGVEAKESARKRGEGLGNESGSGAVDVVDAVGGEGCEEEVCAGPAKNVKAEMEG